MSMLLGRAIGLFDDTAEGDDDIGVVLGLEGHHSCAGGSNGVIEVIGPRVLVTSAAATPMTPTKPKVEPPRSIAVARHTALHESAESSSR